MLSKSHLITLPYKETKMKTTLYNVKSIKFLKTIIVSTFLLIPIVACQSSKTSNLALLSSQIPTDTPLIFAPGILTSDSHRSGSITFNPNMTELVFNYRKHQGKIPNIYTMKLIDGQWSKPKLASFSTDEYLDFHPRFTSNGNRLYFGSTRPVSDTIKTSSSRTRLHQWYVEKNENDDWGEPILMGQPFKDRYVMGAVPSENGNLYFTSGTRVGADDEGIYYAINKNGQYNSIERMDDVINTNGKFIAHPYIAPDESYLIYDSEKATEPDNNDLFISFNTNDIWTESYNLGSKINTKLSEGAATVSPDGKYLFFSRSEKKVKEDGSSYWVSKLYWMDFVQLKKEILESINSN